MRKYLLPVSLGFAGMFAAHVIILLGFGLGIKIPLYFLSYPAVYSLLAFLLARHNPKWWLSNVICILLVPLIYWLFLLWDIGKLHWTNAFSFGDAGGMLLILPFTFAVAMFVSFLVFRRKSLNPSQH